MNEVAQRGIDPNRPYPPSPYQGLPEVPSFSLTSQQFSNRERLPKSASADGGSVSPDLVWAGFPPETKSFAVTCFDPDAPRSGGFWHWLVLNIPVTVTNLAAGAGAPNSSIGDTVENDAGYVCYAGARPPSGDHEHRYFFAVHALDTANFATEPAATCAETAAKLVPHTLARAVLTGTYQR